MRMLRVGAALLLTLSAVELFAQNRLEPKSMNSIMVIFPYRHQGTWVFDDENTGLVREPFVAGIDTMIDQLVKDIPDAEKGFKALFSAAPFPGFTVRLDWRRTEFGGSWYYADEFKLEGWLCPALFKYFPTAPKEIYVRAEQKRP